MAAHIERHIKVSFHPNDNNNINNKPGACNKIFILIDTIHIYIHNKKQLVKHHSNEKRYYDEIIKHIYLTCKRIDNTTNTPLYTL